MAPDPALTIDRLASAAGMTVRNVRAHAARGLLPAPHMRGRTGLYGSEHLARLELITRLQSQGFSLAAIERLVAATPRQSAEEALGQYLEMLAPWRPEAPVELRADELGSWLGLAAEPAMVAALEADGVLEPLDEGWVRVHHPGLVRAGAEAIKLGIPAPAVLALRRELLDQVRGVTDRFIELFRSTVWASFTRDGLPPERIDEVRETVTALQPVAAQALLAAFRQVMPEAVGEFVVEASEELAAGARAAPTIGDDGDP